MASHPSKDALIGRSRECEALDHVIEKPGTARAESWSFAARLASGSLPSSNTSANAHRPVGSSTLSASNPRWTSRSRACISFARSMLDNIDRLPDPQHVTLATLSGLAAGPPPDPLLLGLSVLGLLVAVAEDGPLVCVVDDAQWLDHATERTLAFVARRLLAESIALVFAVHNPAAPDALEGLPGLRVEGLAHEEALALLDTVITVPFDARVRERVVAETRGNPWHWLSCPALSPAEVELGFGLHDTMPIAGRIEQGYLRQLQQLSPDTRLLLLAASIEPLGDVPLLWRAAEHLSIGVDSAAPAEETGLVHSEGGLNPPPFGEGRCLSHRGHERCAPPASSRPRPTPNSIPSATPGIVRAVAEPDEGVVQALERAAEHALGHRTLVTAAAFLQRATELTADPSIRATRALMATAWKVFAADYETGLELHATAELCPLDELQPAWLLWLRAGVSAGSDSHTTVRKCCSRRQPCLHLSTRTEHARAH